MMWVSLLERQPKYYIDILTNNNCKKHFLKNSKNILLKNEHVIIFKMN
jgi:hypothetical protein